MKVISIKQPWASLIINGYKKYEFRTWKTNYHGKLLIHASKTVDKKAIERFKYLNLEYPTGVIIGEVELKDCVHMNESLTTQLYNQDKDVYQNVLTYEGYAWELEHTIKYDEPISINGKLGLWELDEKYMDLKRHTRS